MELFIKLVMVLIYGSLVATYATRSLMCFVEMRKSDDAGVIKANANNAFMYLAITLCVAGMPFLFSLLNK